MAPTAGAPYPRRPASGVSRAGGPRETTDCGPLDVGDAVAHIPTTPLGAERVSAALRAAGASPAFDGPPHPPPGPARGRPRDEHPDSVVFGNQTVAKAQRREHELLASAHWFERVRRTAGFPAPSLLDAGVVDTPSGSAWWVIMSRLSHHLVGTVTPERQYELGESLRRWHSLGPPAGLRLDDPGGLGVFLGTPRTVAPAAATMMAGLLADLCPGLPMTAVHGDVGVSLNSLLDGHRRLALIDPGAVHVAPPVLDLAWALAVDLPRGGSVDPLLDGYGRSAVPGDVLDAVLPVALARRLVDQVLVGDRPQVEWLVTALDRSSPALLRVVRQSHTGQSGAGRRVGR